MTFVITAACIDELDGACLTVCPVDCIFEGLRSRYINPDQCIDCGACEPACPVGAIFNEYDVPQTLEPFVEDNKTFMTKVLSARFAELGASATATKVGPAGTDTELVASYLG